MTGQFMARCATAAMTALFVCLIVVPAQAQNVTMPTPRQQQATGSIATPAPPARGTVGQAPHTQPPNPVFNPFATLLGRPGFSSSFSPEQRSIIDRVNNYLSNTQILSGRFVQVGPDGRRTAGEFHIAKPGRVRFEYDDPSPIELIADGQSVVVRDRHLATQDVYPLSQTPLRFLLSDHVDLMHDTKLLAVSADDMFNTVVVEEKNGIVGTSRLMIMFGAKDMQLKQWTVTDPQGLDTTVAVYNLDSVKKPDPNLFVINYMK